jgi:hypothetical protein
MDGTLETCDGSTATFENFFTDQPQRNFTDEMFMGIRVRGWNDSFAVGRWIDIVPDTRLGDLSYGVVKVPAVVPEVPTWVSAVFGLVGALLSKRAANHSD